LSTLYIQDKNR